MSLHTIEQALSRARTAECPLVMIAAGARRVDVAFMNTVWAEEYLAHQPTDLIAVHRPGDDLMTLRQMLIENTREDA